jgi:hypothetical protein
LCHKQCDGERAEPAVSRADATGQAYWRQNVDKKGACGNEQSPSSKAQPLRKIELFHFIIILKSLKFNIFVNFAAAQDSNRV